VKGIEMSTIRITFNNSDQRVVKALKSRGVAIAESLRVELDRLMYELMARVQRKLSGEVLQPRAGGRGLLGSVRKRVTERIGSQIYGGVQAGGAGLGVYPRVHEFGGERSYEILPGALTGKSDKQALAFFPSGSPALNAQFRRMRVKLGTKRGTLKPEKYGEFRGLGGVVVRRVLHGAAQKRSFMISSLEEMRATIIERIHRAAAKAIKR
jgi:hypothetical protein